MNLERPPIIRRRVDLDFGQLDDGRWTSGGAYFEEILNVVSYFFPIGERYFIDSVQHYEGRITDPVLKAQVKDFIYQEAMHTKQHIRSNRVLDQTHSYGQAIAKISDVLLYKTRWFMPKATQLAVSCAIEHYTALLSHYLLRTLSSFVSVSNSSFGALWAWHAVEETEHKAVCFDVYQYVFGKGIFSYLHRAVVMAVVSLFFLSAIITGLFFIKKGGRKPLPAQIKQKAPQQKSSYRQLWRLISRSMSPKLYFDYYRPSFHPWDHDNSHLVEEWKQAFPDFGASPSGKITGDDVDQGTEY